MTQPDPQQDNATFRLRDYQGRDFDALYKLDRLCFDPAIAYSRAELASYIERRRSFTIVAERVEARVAMADKPSIGKTLRNALAGTKPDGAPLVGFVTVHYHKEGYGHIITIDTHPEFRRHGLGTMLMEAAADRLRKQTAFMMVLEVAVNNEAAINFYEKHGFKRIKIMHKYYNREIDAIFMTKRI